MSGMEGKPSTATVHDGALRHGGGVVAYGVWSPEVLVCVMDRGLGSNFWKSGDNLWCATWAYVVMGVQRGEGGNGVGGGQCLAEKPNHLEKVDI